MRSRFRGSSIQDLPPIRFSRGFSGGMSRDWALPFFSLENGATRFFQPAMNLANNHWDNPLASANCSQHWPMLIFESGGRISERCRPPYLSNHVPDPQCAE